MDINLINKLQKINEEIGDGEGFVKGSEAKSNPLPTSFELEKALADIDNLLKIQGTDGNWNYCEYMQGLYNGMELIRAVLVGDEPLFKDAPEEWLENKTNEGIYQTLTNDLLKQAFEARRTKAEVFDDNEHDHMPA